HLERFFLLEFILIFYLFFHKTLVKVSSKVLYKYGVIKILGKNLTLKFHSALINLVKYKVPSQLKESLLNYCKFDDFIKILRKNITVFSRSIMVFEIPEATNSISPMSSSNGSSSSSSAWSCGNGGGRSIQCESSISIFSQNLLSTFRIVSKIPVMIQKTIPTNKKLPQLKEGVDQKSFY
ncbi:hypothetical protein BpHYR1_054020, partial [Brachionus plicatilis]